MPTSRPGIILDQEGVCSACIGSKEKSEKFNWESRGKELDEILF